MATGFANQASTYAADAKTASDQAQASAAAAVKSRDEANKAADEAIAAIFTKQQDDSTDGKLQNATAFIDDQGRISYIDAVPQGDPKADIKDDLSRCEAGDMMLSAYGNVMKPLDPTVWHNDAAGKPVCTVTLTVKATGTTDYYMKTCPEPNLTIAACRGKYTTWNTVLLSSSPVDAQYTQTVDITYAEYVKKYRPKVDTGQILYDMTIGDFVKCYNDPGFNAPCGMVVANAAPFIPALAKSVKAVVAFRYALTTGVGIEDAKLAVQASLDGYNTAALAKLTATADAVAKFRNTLKDGIGTDAALEALRQDRNVERSLVSQLQDDATVAAGARGTCPPGNSFLPGTKVLMGDGTTRAIETLRVGDLVLAADPANGVTGPRVVTATIRTPDDRDFTELTVRNTDGTQSAVTATDHHPFWVESAGGWTDAAAIRPGDTLRTDTGTTVQVASVRHWTGLEPAYNLTVDGLHTYFVLAGDSPVLVHNSSPCPTRIWLILQKLRSRKNPTTGKEEGKTSGQVLLPDGDKLVEWGGPVLSGVNGDAKTQALVDEISNWLRRPESTVRDKVPDTASIYPSADHVETKLAWVMQRDGINYAEIVINNTGGLCGPNFSCLYAVPDILFNDQKMVVRWYNRETGKLDEVTLKGLRERPTKE